MSRISDSALDLAKQRFFIRGESVAEWARERGFAAPHVYSVLSGRSKALRGQSHLIAVALGLKPQENLSRTESMQSIASSNSHADNR